MPEDNKLARIETSIDRPTANALAINRSATSGTFTIAPQNMGELLEFSKLMAVSGFCVRPAFRGNPGACLGVALQAFRCGGDPFAWCNKAYITRNKAGEEQISYEAQLVHAVVNSSSVLQRRLRPTYEGQGTARRCRIVGWVKGETEPLEYESPPISQIAVKNSPLWVVDPDQQLFYYSSRAWARRHVPEILLGIYAPEDFTETIDLTPEPEPRREDFAIAAEPADERPEYVVTDNDGELYTYRVADRAVEGIAGVLREAARGGLERLKAAWENNQATVEQLAYEGCEEAAALAQQYEQHRKELTSPPVSHPRTATERPGPDASVGPASGQGEPTEQSSRPVVAGSAADDPGVAAGAAAHQGERPSQAITPPLRNGKPDYRTWALALMKPKILQQQTTVDLATLLGDNEGHLQQAERQLTGQHAPIWAELQAAIEVQWKVVKNA